MSNEWLARTRETRYFSPVATLFRFDSRLARLRDMITALRPGVAAVLFAALALAAMPLGPNTAAAVGHVTESESRQMRSGEASKRIALGIADEDGQAAELQLLETSAGHAGEPVAGDAPQAIFAAGSPLPPTAGEAAPPSGRAAGLHPARPSRQSARGPPVA